MGRSLIGFFWYKPDRGTETGPGSRRKSHRCPIFSTGFQSRHKIEEKMRLPGLQMKPIITILVF